MPRKKTAARKKKAPPPASDQLVDEVLEANSRFYQALTDGDLKAMRAVWDHGVDAMCIHPSGQIYREWADIDDSWQKIFAGGSPKVIPESEQVTVRKDTAAVFCIERIISEAGMGLAGATNVFQRDEKGAWRMIWHHSALLPSMM